MICKKRFNGIFNMKKWILCLVLTAVLLCCWTAETFADHLSGKTDWLVTFTTRERLESNFDAVTDYADAVSQLQPGDDITFRITLANEHAETTDWYMSNKVLSTLEETRNSDATGGAYSYLLTYSGPGGDRELYNSETVGGDNSQGLLEATNALDDFFYLDTLSTGQTGVVTLVVTLDGETQGNSYQLTLADLRMNFAVELKGTETPASPTNPTTTPDNSESENSSSSNRPQNIVKTGDRTNLLPYYIVMAVSGVLFLILAIISVRSRRKERGGR